MNLDWMNERIPRMPKANWFYKFICFITFRARRKLSYKEYILITSELNRKTLGEHEAKREALNKAIELYKWLNGKLPYMG